MKTPIIHFSGITQQALCGVAVNNVQTLFPGMTVRHVSSVSWVGVTCDACKRIKRTVEKANNNAYQRSFDRSLTPREVEGYGTDQMEG